MLIEHAVFVVWLSCLNQPNKPIAFVSYAGKLEIYHSLLQDHLCKGAVYFSRKPIKGWAFWGQSGTGTKTRAGCEKKP